MWQQILLGASRDLITVAVKVLQTIAANTATKAERAAHLEQMRLEWVAAREAAEAAAVGKTLEQIITKKEQ